MYEVLVAKTRFKVGCTNQVRKDVKAAGQRSSISQCEVKLSKEEYIWNGAKKNALLMKGGAVCVGHGEKV